SVNANGSRRPRSSGACVMSSLAFRQGDPSRRTLLYLGCQPLADRLAHGECILGVGPERVDHYERTAKPITVAPDVIALAIWRRSDVGLALVAGPGTVGVLLARVGPEQTGRRVLERVRQHSELGCRLRDVGVEADLDAGGHRSRRGPRVLPDGGVEAGLVHRRLARLHELEADVVQLGKEPEGGLGSLRPMRARGR